MWQWLMTDVTTVAKDVLELSQNRPEKQVYMSLPRPGVGLNNYFNKSMHYIYKYKRKQIRYLNCFSLDVTSEK